MWNERKDCLRMKEAVDWTSSRLTIRFLNLKRPQLNRVVQVLTGHRNLQRHKKTTRGGVEDTRLEAKDTKKIRGQGQGQPFRGQTLSRPRTGMLEAKAKDQGHKRKCSPKKKKVFTNIFQAIS